MSEYVSEKPKTVCVECRHHRNTHDGSKAGPPPDIWYYQECRAQAPPFRFNTLTGQKERSDWPTCSMVNDGNCPHYKLKP